MCRSHADGGRRCPRTATGRALDALRRQRNRHPGRAAEVDRRIARLRAARDRYGPVVNPFGMPVSDGVAAALEVARRAGNPLIVGGAVRDAALGADPKDIDIEVYGTTIDQLAQRFRDAGYNVDEVGK